VLSIYASDEKYYSTLQGLVYRWKLSGAIYVASIGGGVCALTVLAHFETVCFPRYWVKIFRDGSLAERNLIFAMLVFWAAGVHICTSSLSVGENQANVFFTTWIAFGSIALNYGVWRESAGLPSMADKIMNSHNRETTYNWRKSSLNQPHKPTHPKPPSTHIASLSLPQFGRPSFPPCSPEARLTFSTIAMISNSDLVGKF
jgi:hypothetical protein